MKTPINTKDAAASAITQEAVQTSAQPEVAVVHAQPSTGGSYTCNPTTGGLVKNELPAAANEKE